MVSVDSLKPADADFGLNEGTRSQPPDRLQQTPTLPPPKPPPTPPAGPPQISMSSLHLALWEEVEQGMCNQAAHYRGPSEPCSGLTITWTGANCQCQSFTKCIAIKIGVLIHLRLQLAQEVMGERVTCSKVARAESDSCAVTGAMGLDIFQGNVP